MDQLNRKRKCSKIYLTSIVLTRPLKWSSKGNQSKTHGLLKALPNQISRANSSSTIRLLTIRFILTCVTNILVCRSKSNHEWSSTRLRARPKAQSSKYPNLNDFMSERVPFSTQVNRKPKSHQISKWINFSMTKRIIERQLGAKNLRQLIVWLK